MKCALRRLLFISAAFCEGFIAAADAEEVNGPGAVRERIGPLINKLSRKGVGSTAELAKEYDQFLQVALKAEGEAMEDRASLSCLQRYSKLVKQWTEETAAMYRDGFPSSPASAASR